MRNHNSDYYREEAARYKKLAEAAADPARSRNTANWLKLARKSPTASTTCGQADSQQVVHAKRGETQATNRN